MTFGQKIRKLRNEAGLTQKELAEELNVTFQTVSKWESDVNEPDISNIKQLAKIFHCSVEFLFSDDDSGDPKKVDNSETTSLVSTTPIEEKDVEKVAPRLASFSRHLLLLGG